jgi:hypothetical protein
MAWVVPHNDMASDWLHDPPLSPPVGDHWYLDDIDGTDPGDDLNNVYTTNPGHWRDGKYGCHVLGKVTAFPFDHMRAQTWALVGGGLARGHIIVTYKKPAWATGYAAISTGISPYGYKLYYSGESGGDWFLDEAEGTIMWLTGRLNPPPPGGGIVRVDEVHLRFYDD